MTLRSGHRALRRGRCSAPQFVYLITTVTENRRPHFSDFYVGAAACAALASSALTASLTLKCWVLMPDHLHLLLQLNSADDLVLAMTRLKSRMAQAANAVLGRSGQLWARGFHDRALRDEEAVLRAARYIIANPLRAGLVRRVGSYPFWGAEWL